MMPQAVADALRGYVQQGGTLISEARPAWNDDRGFANAVIPGFGLDTTFGVREKLLQAGENVTMVAERDLEGALRPLAGRSIPGTGFAEHLDVTGENVRVLARFPGEGGRPGDPAIVMNEVRGDARNPRPGRAILIGSFPAAAFEQDPDKMRPAGDLLQALVAFAGVSPEVRIDGAAGSVEARFIESSDALVLIAINHAETPQKVTMAFTPDTQEAVWQNIETGAAVNFVAGPNGPTYTHAFAPRDVLVLTIRKKLR